MIIIGIRSNISTGTWKSKMESAKQSQCKHMNIILKHGPNDQMHQMRSFYRIHFHTIISHHQMFDTLILLSVYLV